MLRARRALLGSRAAVLLRLIAAEAAAPAVGGGGGESLPVGECRGEDGACEAGGSADGCGGVDGGAGGGGGESGDSAAAGAVAGGDARVEPSLSAQTAAGVAGDDYRGEDAVAAATTADAGPLVEVVEGALLPPALRDPVADGAQQLRSGMTARELAVAADSLAAIVGDGEEAGGEDDLERALTTAAALVEGLRRTLYEVHPPPLTPPLPNSPLSSCLVLINDLW
jgi:hypothetical protein